MIIKGRRLSQHHYESVDTDTMTHCWLHNIDPKDEKKMEKIKLVEGHTTDKEGKEEKFRFCPKCYQIVKYT